MTTREATGLLSRSGDSHVIGDYARKLSDRMAVIAFGAFQWPWLVRSLHGGRLKDKHALLDRLGLPHDSMPYLGSWKADTGLLKLLVDHIETHRPRLVVEFGTVTGRKRRCGWFDAALVRQSMAVSGVTGIALTKLDVLDGLEEIRICTG